MKLDDASGERKVELAMEAASKGRYSLARITMPPNLIEVAITL